MSNPRALTALLVPAGVIVGHAVVPVLFHDHGVVAHSALHSHGWAPAVNALVALAAFVGLGRSVFVDTRRAPVLFRTLAPLQLAAYSTVELVEAGGNAGAMLGQPALWLGLGVQLVLAAVVVVLVRAGRRLVERFRTRPFRLRRCASCRAASSGRDWIPAAAFLTVRVVRGPPTHALVMLVR